MIVVKRSHSTLTLLMFINDRAGAIGDFQAAAKLYEKQGDKWNSSKAVNLAWQLQQKK
jgi:hypothetical protein